jgi:hypothetical protein
VKTGRSDGAIVVWTEVPALSLAATPQRSASQNGPAVEGPGKAGACRWHLARYAAVAVPLSSWSSFRCWRSGAPPAAPGPVGLANGWAYHAAAAQKSAFFDITQGNNDLAGVGCCTATVGYDLASGLGVPNWAILPATLPRRAEPTSRHPRYLDSPAARSVAPGPRTVSVDRA